MGRQSYRGGFCSRNTLPSLSHCSLVLTNYGLET
uniref:Uncharacterized protein n=1 Tax=Rhizophora mucronata TaxID=61149 RepID=A0A2P2N432_RHIMU